MLPIVSYEVRYIRHKDIYTDEDWGDDYDCILADPTTRIQKFYVQRTESDLELANLLCNFMPDFDQFQRLLPWGIFDSALINNSIDCYLEDRQVFPHLWIDDYLTNCGHIE